MQPSLCSVDGSCVCDRVSWTKLTLRSKDGIDSLNPALPHSRIREWIKQARSGEEEEERQERQSPGRWWKESHHFLPPPYNSKSGNCTSILVQILESFPLHPKKDLFPMGAQQVGLNDKNRFRIGILHKKMYPIMDRSTYL